MKYVSVSGMSVSYDGKEVLSDVNLSIESDDFLGIIGPNGGGKTTLIKAILGLIPFSGDVLFAKELMSNGKPKIGYLPQITEFDKIFPISVIDVVVSGLQGAGVFHFGRNEYRRAEETMRRVGIDHIAKKPIGNISGGEMQRALLCRAIVSEPKLLILDEPANFVDNKFEKELYEILQELNRRMAIVMVSHDIGTITSVVKNIVCVNKYVHRHSSNLITAEQLENYNCPIQLVAHGHIPHTILEKHD